jgi:hypothetical protein
MISLAPVAFVRRQTMHGRRESGTTLRDLSSGGGIIAEDCQSGTTSLGLPCSHHCVSLELILHGKHAALGMSHTHFISCVPQIQKCLPELIFPHTLWVKVASAPIESPEFVLSNRSYFSLSIRWCSCLHTHFIVPSSEPSRYCFTIPLGRLTTFAQTSLRSLHQYLKDLSTETHT